MSYAEKHDCIWVRAVRSVEDGESLGVSYSLGAIGSPGFDLRGRLKEPYCATVTSSRVSIEPCGDGQHDRYHKQDEPVVWSWIDEAWEVAR